MDILFMIVLTLLVLLLAADLMSTKKEVMEVRKTLQQILTELRDISNDNKKNNMK